MTAPAPPAARSAARPRRRPAPLPVLVPALLAGLAVAVCFGVAVGTVTVPLDATVSVLASHLLPGRWGEFTVVQEQFVWEFRLPRVLLAAAVGAGLAVVGVLMQAVVRNPLADPYVLGVSAGAGLGAVTVFVLVPAAAVGFPRYGASFAGALVALAAVLVLARERGRFTPRRVVLAGVTLSYLFTALTSFLIFRSDDPRAANSVLFFLLGTLQDARWDNIAVAAAVVVGGLVVAQWYARPLNAFVVGDETATALGYDVDRVRLVLLVTSALVTGVLVAIAGGVGFVGLVVPHAVRFLVGSDHRRLLPVAALASAVYLVLVDVLCRVVVSPAELPLGVVTAVLGAPYFLLLLRRNPRAKALS
ncbi:MAG: FecCD family ABC transporter permease [Pseudonocardia sp.]